jgi:uncharacterized membrane protein YdjX (TVP38/TMEM64 family)
MILLKLQPMLPQNVLNYVLSVSRMSGTVFFIGGTIGMLPATIVWLYVGVNLSSIEELIDGKRDINILEISILGASSLMIFVILFLVSRESKR